MSLLASLREKHGLLAPRAVLSRVVAHTDDLTRIRDAPRRVWQERDDLPEAIALLTEWLRYNDRPCPDPSHCEGCRATTLKPAQAAGLLELADSAESEGAFWPLRPGAGKTLMTLLAGTVTSSPKPLLLVPASGLDKTQAAIRQYRKHWRVHMSEVRSYEWLANPKQLHALDAIAPTIVVCDEAHKLKDSRSKCWKRLARYAKAHPETRLVFATGTAGGRSLREYWHYLRAALRSRAPVPRDPMEAQTWAAAIDEKVPPLARFEPGPLVTLSPGVTGPDAITIARRAYRARLTETRGVISTLEDVPPCDLLVRAITLPLPPSLVSMLETMRRTWRTPGGEQFLLPLDMWGHQRTLGCGLYYHWVPPPPRPWRDARREWFTWANNELAHSRTIDSLVHVLEEIAAGTRDDEGRHAAWEAERVAFGKPNSEAVWCDTTALSYAARWLGEADPAEPRICWAQQRAFGDRLARETGVPYFADGGLDARGTLVNDFTGPCAIASISAVREQFNMQHFTHGLVTCPMSTGAAWDQLLARWHRDGQGAELVTCDILLTSRESWQCLAQACRDGVHAQETSGQPHRLVYASKEGWDTVSSLVSGENPELWFSVGV